MRLVFIRHAMAESAGGGGSEGGKLTREGTQQAKAVAIALKAMGIDIQRVFTSPLLHAAETGGIIAHEFGGVGLEAIEALTPPGDGRRLRQRIAELMDSDIAAAAVVGHAPSLGEMLGELIADTRSVGVEIPRAGAAMIELPVEEAPNGAVLHWLLTYEQIEAVALWGRR